ALSLCRDTVLHHQVDRLRPGNGELAFFFFSSRRRHTRSKRDWSSDVCSSDLSDKRYPMHTAQDFYLRGFANVAYAMGRPVPDASDEDMRLTGVDKKLDLIKAHLKEEEWLKVAMLMTRGGRFDRVEDAWDGDHLKHAHLTMLPIWDEELASLTYSMTGEKFSG